MNQRFVASIDQGTTSTRCILFDAAGPVAVAQKEHAQHFPQPGWVEHDPVEIWTRTQEVIAGAMGNAGARAADIAAVGITNQRETAVVWDCKTGQPLYRAVVWSDTRTRDICSRFAADGGQDRFRAATGLPLATYFSAPKLRWLLANVPGLRKKVADGEAIFGTIDSWIIWNLTGGPDGGAHLTDVSNASRTMLMDLRSLQWSDELLSAFDVPREMLPKIVPSIDRRTYGMTRRDGPFAGEIPVCGCLGDQQAALVGQTCFIPGESKNTYGTGCFMLLNTGPAPVVSKSGLLTTVAYQIDEQPAHYALEGSIAVAGSLVQWLRDSLGLIATSPEVEALAATVEDNGDIYFVPAFSGLFAPYWRSDARGLIAGLTGYANKGHLARAVLEAAAYQTRDVLDAMRKDSGVSLKSLRVDGGMAANSLLMQFQADVLNVPVVRPKVTETTALGAAYAAGLAVGYWKGFEHLRSCWKEDKTWTPGMDEAAREKLLKGWGKAVERAMGWV
ncbi:MAG TPA: glycerol kinase GlpK [Tepidisphaeraceae bacterium]|jgi:glycerol kinase|nr:glycerol kinase GlpK [Tepidisphaeraceae bacterium]